MKAPLVFGGIMLPSKEVDLTRFATVACDQFTSDREYWSRLDKFVGDSPSALRITYPEIFLNDSRSERMRAIIETARDYLDRGVFCDRTYDAVLTERSTPFTASRQGLVLSVDLSAYSLDGEDLIRASEGVVKERIPVRAEIRENTPIELPHIMLLCADEEGLLVEKAHEKKGRKLYDFDLNMGGGHLTGWEAEDTGQIEKAAETLIERSAERYGKPFLFAVGDGNHSLAAALSAFRSGKSAGSALCEIVNVYSSGVVFHPIHRLVKAKNNADFVRYMQAKTSSFERAARLICDGEVYRYKLPADAVDGVERVQRLIDEYGAEEVDYIHGESQLSGRSFGRVGVELFAPSKSEFFDGVAKRGKLPKKTFSIGEGEEKRYYLEARKIKEA